MKLHAPESNPQKPLSFYVVRVRARASAVNGGEMAWLIESGDRLDASAERRPKQLQLITQPHAVNLMTLQSLTSPRVCH